MLSSGAYIPFSEDFLPEDYMVATATKFRQAAPPELLLFAWSSSNIGTAPELDFLAMHLGVRVFRRTKPDAYQFHGVVIPCFKENPFILGLSLAPQERTPLRWILKCLHDPKFSNFGNYGITVY